MGNRFRRTGREAGGTQSDTPHRASPVAGVARERSRAASTVAPTPCASLFRLCPSSTSTLHSICSRLTEGQRNTTTKFVLPYKARFY